MVTRVTIDVALSTFRLLGRAGRLVSLSCISGSVRTASLASPIRTLGDTRAEDVAQ